MSIEVVYLDELKREVYYETPLRAAEGKTMNCDQIIKLCNSRPDGSSSQFKLLGGIFMGSGIVAMTPILVKGGFRRAMYSCTGTVNSVAVTNCLPFSTTTPQQGLMQEVG